MEEGGYIFNVFSPFLISTVSLSAFSSSLHLGIEKAFFFLFIRPCQFYSSGFLKK